MCGVSKRLRLNHGASASEVDVVVGVGVAVDVDVDVEVDVVVVVGVVVGVGVEVEGEVVVEVEVGGEVVVGVVGVGGVAVGENTMSEKLQKLTRDIRAIVIEEYPLRTNRIEVGGDAYITWDEADEKCGAWPDVARRILALLDSTPEKRVSMCIGCTLPHGHEGPCTDLDSTPEETPDRPTLLAALQVVVGPHYDDVADPVAYVRELRGGFSTPEGESNE